MLEILIADEHPVVRRGLRYFLEQRSGWVICGEAKDGREVLELARRLQPGVTVMDLLLPELNGLDATRMLLREVPTTEVLIFTASQSEQLALEALAAGARGYLLRTDSPELIVQAVDSVSRHVPFITERLAQTVARSLGTGPSKRKRAALLTSRERQIVQLIAEGRRTRDIAESLGISGKTVETHRTAVMRKLHLASLAEVVRYAIRNSIVAQ